MLLHHFTCHHNFEMILDSGVLRKGAIGRLGGRVADAAISLTSDLDPSGHGLTMGEIVTENQAIKLGFAKEDKASGILRSIDHSRFRIDFVIDNTDRNLVSAKAFHTLKEFEALQVTALWPPGLEMPAADELRIRAEIKAGRMLSKGYTWWYYLADLPLANAIAVAGRLEDGTFHQATVDEFRQAR